MTDDELKALEALAEKATTGPWSERWLYGALRHINRNVDRDCFIDDADLPDGARWPGKEDAAFISACRTAVPALIAEVRRLQAREARATEIMQIIRTEETVDIDVSTPDGAGKPLFDVICDWMDG